MSGFEILAAVGGVSGFLLIVGLIAAAFAKWRSTTDETTAALWKGEAEAQKARADRYYISRSS